MSMKDFRAFVTDLWVRLCTFLLLLLEAEPFSKGEKEERDLKIGDSRRSNGFNVSKERKGSEKGGCWREKVSVNDQRLPVYRSESSNRDGDEDIEIEEKYLKIGGKKFDLEHRLKNERNGGRDWSQKRQMKDHSLPRTH